LQTTLRGGFKVLRNDNHSSKKTVTKPNLKMAGLQLSACMGLLMGRLVIIKFIFLYIKFNSKEVMRPVSILVFLLIYSATNFATTYHVPSSYNTISAALLVCQQNDTVLVQPGVYIESISWPAVDGIKLISAGDSSNTIISGGNVGRPLTIMSSSIITGNTIIKGFSIKDGRLTNTNENKGAGIYISNASPTLIDLQVYYNVLDTSLAAWGAGIFTTQSASEIIGCFVHDNRIDSASFGYGAGMYLSQSNNLTLKNCIISRNTNNCGSFAYGAGIYATEDSIKIIDSKIINNMVGSESNSQNGGGISFSNCTINMENSLVAGNIFNYLGTFFYGAGICGQNNGNLKIAHCSIVMNKKSNNGSITGTGIYLEPQITFTALNSILYNPTTASSAELSATGNVNVNYCLVRNGYTGVSNLNLIPLLNVDYSLSSLSPCINAGIDTLNINTDINGNQRPMPIGTNPDLGCFEFDQGIVSIANMVEINDSALKISYLNTAFIKVNGLKAGYFEILNMDGKTVYVSNCNTSELTIDVSAFSKGIYIAKNKDRARKFIVY